MGAPLKIIYEQVNPRWEVAVCLSAEKGFQQVSFVNSIATTKVNNFTAGKSSEQKYKYVLFSVLIANLEPL